MKLLNEFHGARLAFIILLALLCGAAACSDSGGGGGFEKPGVENASSVASDRESKAASAERSVSLQDENAPALARIVFVTTSRACDCTMKRCENAEKVLNEAIAGHPEAPAVEKIDFATEKDRAMKIMEKYPAMMLPVIYFLDKDENLLQRLDGEIFGEEVYAVIEKYTRGRN